MIGPSKRPSSVIDELVSLVGHDADGGIGRLFASANDRRSRRPPVTITCKPGDSLDHIADASIDVVVMDPPYYDNVMYAELSDFFYVWLKRTAGPRIPRVVPRPPDRQGQRSRGQPGAIPWSEGGQGAGRARLPRANGFDLRRVPPHPEARRRDDADVHPTKATGAWDALTKGLMDAGFAITASWPVNTEAEGSMHIRDKAAAKSTIFLVCRPPRLIRRVSRRARR